MMALKLWNGRGALIMDRDREPFKTWDMAAEYSGRLMSVHIFICAKSVRDAKEMISGYLGYMPRGIDTEFRVYFSKGCWGNSMDGIPSPGTTYKSGKLHEWDTGGILRGDTERSFGVYYTGWIAPLNSISPSPQTWASSGMSIRPLTKVRTAKPDRQFFALSST